MSSTVTSENLQTIFTFPFKDQSWKSKFTIGSLLYMIGIFILPGFFVGGYSYEVMRQIIVDDRDPSMPEWDDFGEYFQNGFKLFGVGFLYGSPTLMLMLPYLVLILFFPFFITGAIPDEYIDMLFVAFPVTLGLMIIGSLVGFVFGMFGVVAKGHMVATGEFAAAFRFREWWPILRNNLGGFLLAYLVLMALSWVITFAVQLLMATLILCIVVPFLMAAVCFYLGLVSNALFAKAYADGVKKLTALEIE